MDKDALKKQAVEMIATGAMPHDVSYFIDCAFRDAHATIYQRYMDWDSSANKDFDILIDKPSRALFHAVVPLFMARADFEALAKESNEAYVLSEIKDYHHTIEEARAEWQRLEAMHSEENKMEAACAAIDLDYETAVLLAKKSLGKGAEDVKVVLEDNKLVAYGNVGAENFRSAYNYENDRWGYWVPKVSYIVTDKARHMGERDTGHYVTNW